ncbi:CHASE domain-containing protein [Oceanimonas sp. NS1]|nr:CHASE domain-containing protein [Oceanimonas sp. NS1]
MHDNTALKGMEELGFARFVRESERRAHLAELRRNRLPEHRIHPPASGTPTVMCCTSRPLLNTLTTSRASIY